MERVAPTRSSPNGSWRCVPCSRARDRAPARRAQKRDRYANNKDVILEQNRDAVSRWSRENRDRKAAAAALHRAGDQRCECCSPSDIALTYKLTGPCSLGGCSAPAENVDHHIPLKLGGLHCLSNLKLLCKFHNESKGARLFEDWRKGEN